MRRGRDPLALFKYDGSGPLCVPTYTSRCNANVARVQVKQLFINITKRRYWRPHAAPGALPRRCITSKSSWRPTIMPYVKRIVDADDPLSRTPDAFLNVEMICANGKGIHAATTALTNFSRSSFCSRSGNFPSVDSLGRIVQISQSLCVIVCYRLKLCRILSSSYSRSRKNKIKNVHNIQF